MARVTFDLYMKLRRLLVDAGYGADYQWSQNLKRPASAEALACEYTWVVINSGMKNTVARKIFDRVWPALLEYQPVIEVFRHPGKAHALQTVWAGRADYFEQFGELEGAAAVLEWCVGLPWIGQITKYHLAKNLGEDVAKPDRWLLRLAEASGETVDALCARLAAASGDRVATVDLVLWRACAIGLLTVVDGLISLACSGTKY